ncbi:MAG: Bug family tripartite tricarboxylate transporter substrate binding protein [Xanthobacteraceae bacterium]
MLRLTFPVILTALLASAPARGKDAAQFPAQPIKIIVCVPAGGGVDTVTRIVADKLHQRFNQPVVVENRGGQAGNFGAEAVFAAEPDGYTLLASQPAPLTVNQLLYRKLNYDPAAFVPVTIMTTIPNVLAVRPDFPASTFEEFIAYAKANPGKLNYASQGTGTTSHLTAELFQSKTGAQFVHVPYKGTAPALNDLIAGHIDMMFTEAASALELSRANKVRILAVAALQRSSLLPDVPTFIEAGISDFISGTWNAISAPPKTPASIVGKLNEAIVGALKSEDVTRHLQALNVQTAALSSSEAATFVADDSRRWADVIRSAKITPE